MSLAMSMLDPASILIRRDVRQRKAPEIDDNFKSSISTHGLINAIVVRQEGADIVLIAGERRLLACRALGKSLEIGRDVKFLDALSPLEAREVELEENIQRQDLPWRDYARAVGELHFARKSIDPTWIDSSTANRLGLDRSTVNIIIHVFSNLDSELLADATGIENAYGILQRASERRAAAIVNDIITASSNAFGNLPTTSSTTPPSAGDLSPATGNVGIASTDAESPLIAPTPAVVQVEVPEPIILADFTKWALEYSGPKFTLLHVDFPYGISYEKFANSVDSRSGDRYESEESTYWNLVDALTSNLDRLMSYSAHMMFWFSMTFYEETKRRLTSAGLLVHDHPLIWHKTDNSGIVPGAGGQYPRRIYETALLCSRGSRPLIKASGNAYGCPITSGSIHPSQKPEPMLRHFFGMFIDNTTDVLDPTCGSGTSIRAAEDCGARRVLGLELNPEYYSAALGATMRARTLRMLGKQA